MLRNGAAIAALLALSLSAPARADVDIPTAAPCSRIMANAVTNRVYAACSRALLEVDGATHAQRSMPATGDRVYVQHL